MRNQAVGFSILLASILGREEGLGCLVAPYQSSRPNFEHMVCMVIMGEGWFSQAPLVLHVKGMACRGCAVQDQELAANNSLVA